MKPPWGCPAFSCRPLPSEFLPASPAAGNTSPTTSGSTACTNSPAGFARTSRLFRRRCQQLPGWPLLADMPPTLRVSQLHKVSSRSGSSSPLAGWQPCSTGQRRPLAPLSLQETPRYYGRLRPSLWHRYSSSWYLPLVIFLSIQGEVLTFRTKACVELMPPIHRLPPGQ